MLEQVPGEVVSASSVQMFKARLGGACSSLIWWVASLAGWLKPVDL